MTVFHVWRHEKTNLNFAIVFYFEIVLCFAIIFVDKVKPGFRVELVFREPVFKSWYFVNQFLRAGILLVNF